MTGEPGNKDENAVEEAVEELLVDPDSPANSDTRHPPQTIDAEPIDAEPSGTGTQR